MLYGKVRPNQGTKLELLKRQMWADRKESKEFPKAGGAEGWWDLEWLCLPHSHTCENWREVSAGAPVGNYGLDPRAETRAAGSQACNGSQAIMRNTTAAILKKTLYPVPGGPDPHTNIQ